jgi:DNA polymerase elongation subunit (family B)
MRDVVLDIETAPCDKAHWDELVKRVPSLAKNGHDRTALDWSFGRIVCIGLSISRHRGTASLAGATGFVGNAAPAAAAPQEHCWAGPDEAALLEQFWKAVQPDDHLIGHNLIGFDLPYIMARSVIAKVKPSRRIDLRRYRTDAVYDTMQVWCGWEAGKYPKLDTLAAIMGFQGKSGSGAQVAGWADAGEWEQIKAYCMDDVRITRSVYERMREFGM